MINFQVKNLASKLDRTNLFKNINVFLNKGELLLIKGQNGSGKTTLLKLFAGLIEPHIGHILFTGKDILKEPAFYRTKMSYLGHKNSLKMWLNPLENIHYQNALANQNEHSAKKLEELIQQFDLKGTLQKPCHQLSQGQRRKVAIAALILKNKPLWIIDEPFAALDIESIQNLKTLFKNHLLDGGLIIMSNHTNVEDFEKNVIDLTKTIA